METSKDLLLNYVRYNLWANKNLAALLKTIDQSWLDVEVKSSFSSLRKTAFHIWDAEYIWLSRFQGTSPTAFPSKNLSADTHPSEFIKGAEAFFDFFEKQTDEFFSASTKFNTMDGTPHDMTNSGIIMHVMNHGSFHRGQLVMMLRNLGYDGPMPRTDMIIFLRELSK